MTWAKIAAGASSSASSSSASAGRRPAPAAAAAPTPAAAAATTTDPVVRPWDDTITPAWAQPASSSSAYSAWTEAAPRPAAPATWTPPRSGTSSGSGSGSGSTDTTTTNSGGPLFITEGDALLSLRHERRSTKCALGFRPEHVARTARAVAITSLQQALWMFEADTLEPGTGRGQAVHARAGLAAQERVIAAIEAEDADARALYIAALREQGVLEALVVGWFTADACWAGVDALLGTGERPLVYLSEDPYFGAGLTDRKRVGQLAKAARGENAFGRALERARAVLRTPHEVARRKKVRGMSREEREWI